MLTLNARLKLVTFHSDLDLVGMAELWALHTVSLRCTFYQESVMDGQTDRQTDGWIDEGHSYNPLFTLWQGLNNAGLVQ